MDKILDIVIVNWNSGGRLRENLASLGAMNDLSGVAVIVVDNASTDGSADDLAEWPGVRLVRLAANAGFAAACNQGIREGSAPMVLFLNPDIHHTPDNLHTLREGLAESLDAAGACGRLVGADSRPTEAFPCRRLPTPGWALAELLLPPGVRKLTAAYRRHFYLDCDLDHLQAVEQPAAACWLLRREALDQAGGFDEGYFPAWYEDVDLAHRLHELGHRTRLVPEACFIHEGGYSVQALGKSSFTTIYWRNARRYYTKTFPLFGMLYRLLFPLGMAWRWLGSLGRPAERRAYGGLFWRGSAPRK